MEEPSLNEVDPESALARPPNEAPQEVRPVVNNPYDDHDGLTS